MASINSMNSMFETAEQRAEREKYEAERKAFFESIPKRAEQTFIVGQPPERLVEELRKQLSELGVMRTLDQQRIAALEAARREEREACAKLADQIAKVAERHFAAMGSAGMGADPGTARDIATAIRARKP